MKYWLGSLFQRNAHSPARRTYFAVLPKLFGVFSKRQSVRFVRINGRTYKRVVFGDSHEAEAVERALLMAPDEAAFPTLIQRHENEMLLDFVGGRRFEPARPDDRDALARFLGALYRIPRTAVDGARLRCRFEIDAAFLNSSGLIDSDLLSALQRRADAVQTEEVEFGLDYTDPVAKNFVVSDGRLFAVDIEGLRKSSPIGTSIAKCAVHWLPDAEVPAFLAEVESHSGDVIGPQFAFVELCFRVGWIKRKLLQGRHRAIRVELLEELTRRAD